MTMDRIFKQAIRDRMKLTGETYMQARANLIAAGTESTNTPVAQTIPGVIHSSGETWESSPSPTIAFSQEDQRQDVISYVIEHSNEWEIAVVDLTLAYTGVPYYADAIVSIAPTYEEGMALLRSVKNELASRQQKMRAAGAEIFTQLPDAPKELMVIINNPTNFLTTKGLELDEMYYEVIGIISAIGRSGRAAGINLLLSNQRQDAVTISNDLKSKLGSRVELMRTVGGTWDSSTPAHLALAGQTKGADVVGFIGKAKAIISAATPSHSSSPSSIPHPGFARSEWNEIALGRGRDGEFTWNPTRYPHLLIEGATGRGKSVLQHNIISHAVFHSSDWKVLGIDLTRGLSRYENYEEAVVSIATDLKTAVDVLRFADNEIAFRYDEQRKHMVTHYTELPEKPQATMVVVNEVVALLRPEQGDTDEAIERNALRSEIRHLLTEIARSGRSAGVHLALSTQRVDRQILGIPLVANMTLDYTFVDDGKPGEAVVAAYVSAKQNIQSYTAADLPKRI